MSSRYQNLLGQREAGREFIIDYIDYNISKNAVGLVDSYGKSYA
jgi:hypothetical protein